MNGNRNNSSTKSSATTNSSSHPSPRQLPVPPPSSSPSSSYFWNSDSSHSNSHNKSENTTKDTTVTLTVSILSVYDLPYREPPSHVNLILTIPTTTPTITTKTIRVRTGPPTQRHRDRNSFKFGGTTTTGAGTGAGAGAGAGTGTTGSSIFESTSYNNIHTNLNTDDGTDTNNNHNRNRSSTPSTRRLPSSNIPSKLPNILQRTLTITHDNLAELYHATAILEVVYVATIGVGGIGGTGGTSSATPDLSSTTTTTTTTTTSFVSYLYPIQQMCPRLNELTWNILVCHTIPQSASYTTNDQTGISNQIQHPIPPQSRQQQQQQQQQRSTTTTPTTSRTTTTTPTTWDQSECTETNHENDDHDVDNEHDVLSSSSQPPTIRIQMTLAGPIREELQTLLHYGTRYLQCMDAMEDTIQKLPPSQFLYRTIMIPLYTQWHDIQLWLQPNPTTSNNTATRSNNAPLTKMVYRTILFLVVPALVMIVLILIPIATVISMIALPFLLPILLLLLGAMGSTSMVVLVWYCSSRHPTIGGRSYMYHTIMAPIVQTILSSNIGQHLVYDIGPRYQPIIELLYQYHIVPVGENVVFQKLIYAIGIDVIGSSSYLIPGIGELMDIVWAPTQTILIMALLNESYYRHHQQQQHQHNSTSVNPNASSSSMSGGDTTTTSHPYNDTINTILPYVSFIEEVLPFTDFVPTATIGWFCIYGVIPILKQPPPKPISNYKND